MSFHVSDPVGIVYIAAVVVRSLINYVPLITSLLDADDDSFGL